MKMRPTYSMYICDIYYNICTLCMFCVCVYNFHSLEIKWHPVKLDTKNKKLEGKTDFTIKQLNIHEKDKIHIKLEKIICNRVI